MWLVIVLVAALALVAYVEHLHWRYWRCWIDDGVRASYLRKVQADVDLLVMLYRTTNLAESIYEASSDYGCPYVDHTRRLVAGAIGEARRMVSDRAGPNPFVVYERSPSSWPFDKEGKVLK